MSIPTKSSYAFTSATKNGIRAQRDHRYAFRDFILVELSRRTDEGPLHDYTQGSSGVFMKENRERWQELCEQASTEQDPVKLLKLISEINTLLLNKERRLLTEDRTP